MKNVKGEFEYLSINHNPSVSKWEEIPDEDLWEDGEMSKKDVKEEIFWRVVTMGDWKLIRKAQ